VSVREGDGSDLLLVDLCGGCLQVMAEGRNIGHVVVRRQPFTRSPHVNNAKANGYGFADLYSEGGPVTEDGGARG